MGLSKLPYYFLLMLGLYLGCSIPIFNQVYETTKVVVDEMFHIPQAQAYCKGHYEVWDPKITTLPGLYVAVQIMNLMFECNTYYLRMFNLILSAVNMGLFYILLNFVYGLCCSRFNIALQALNLAILPPLYFFSHVFYTDTLSLTFLLLLTLSVIKKVKYGTIIFGICSIVTRQTNVIWILMLSSQTALEVMIKSSRVYSNDFITHNRRPSIGMANVLDPMALKRNYDCDDFFVAALFHLRDGVENLYRNSTSNIDLTDFSNISIPVLLFALFVFFNGSIVVGDKEAHTMTLNFPQYLYFLLFYGFFGLPFVLSRVYSTLQYMQRNKRVVVAIAIVTCLAVQFNTVVHPYLLADNRHYSFYIWNRWFGKYPAAVYMTIPVYIFLACSLIDNLIHQNCISFYMAYLLWLIPGVCLQRLLEIRYFIIPYIIARLRFPKSSTWFVALEFLWYATINIAFFAVFFTKEVKWNDFEETQRIIW